MDDSGNACKAREVRLKVSPSAPAIAVKKGFEARIRGIRPDPAASHGMLSLLARLADE